MSYYIPTGGSPIGLNPSPIDVLVHVDSGESAIAAGTLVQFDLVAGGDDTAAAPARFGPGVTTSVWANVVTAADFVHGFYAILLEDIASDGTGLARVLGTVTAVAGTGDVTADTLLQGVATGVTDITAGGEKVIGIGGAAISATASGVIWFDGITGLGHTIET